MPCSAPTAAAAAVVAGVPTAAGDGTAIAGAVGAAGARLAVSSILHSSCSCILSCVVPPCAPGRCPSSSSASSMADQPVSSCSAHVSCCHTAAAAAAEAGCAKGRALAVRRPVKLQLRQYLSLQPRSHDSSCCGRMLLNPGVLQQLGRRGPLGGLLL